MRRGRSPPTDGGYHGAVLDQQYVVPDTPLTDTDGAPYSLAADTDKPLTLVFFGYTHCPDICQVVMATIASALTRLDEQDRDRVDVVFVTTDPARDDEPPCAPTSTASTRPSSASPATCRRSSTSASRSRSRSSRGRSCRAAATRSCTAPRSPRSTTDDRVPILWTQGTSASDLADDIHRLLA